jgi:hypothetical protein
MLPLGDTVDHYVDTAMILRERRHPEPHISRLAGELGRDMKLITEAEDRTPQSEEQQFGNERHQVGLFHRVRDARLIEDVLAAFKLRSLYTRGMASQDSVTGRGTPTGVSADPGTRA